MVRSLLSDLIERGLDADRARLWVIDGGKALRRAIVECFGALALVQRCQEHKRRNVIEHLPEELHASVGRAMRDAWGGANAELAKKQLQHLATSLHWLLVLREPTRPNSRPRSITPEEPSHGMVSTASGTTPVSAIALDNGINANLLFNWRRLHLRRGSNAQMVPATVPTLLPVTVEKQVAPTAPAPSTRSMRALSGVIEIDIGSARVRLRGVVDEATVRCVLHAPAAASCVLQPEGGPRSTTLCALRCSVEDFLRFLGPRDCSGCRRSWSAFELTVSAA